MFPDIKCRNGKVKENKDERFQSIESHLKQLLAVALPRMKLYIPDWSRI